MKKSAISFLAVTFLFSGCLFQDSVDEVLLRIKNVSDTDFSSVVVAFPGDMAKYGTIVSGEKSIYQKFDTAYRYGSITVKAGGVDYQFVPYDYVGEKPLGAGKYTYELNIVDGSLTLEFNQNN